MTDLALHSDETALTVEEISIWLGVSAKAVRRLPLTPLAIATRPRKYLVGDVKRALLDRHTPRVSILRKHA